MFEGSGWAKVVLDETDQGANAGSWPKNIYTPGLLQTLWKWYITTTGPSGYGDTDYAPYNTKIDQIQFENDDYANQNNETISGFSILYEGDTTKKWQVSLMDKYRDNGYSGSTYQLKYSFTAPITNENWSSATPAVIQADARFCLSQRTDGMFSKYHMWYRQVWAPFKLTAADTAQLTPGKQVWFGIRDVGQQGGNSRNPIASINGGCSDGGRDYNQAGFDYAKDSAVLNYVKRTDYVVSGINTPDTEPPALPANFNLAASSPSQSSITVTWNPATDNVGVTNYLVERCQGTGCSNFAQVGTPNASPFIDSGLTPNTFYNYHVRAADGASPQNLSGWSNVVGATTQAPDTQPPTVPANLTATTPSSSTVNLTWTASTDNVAVTGYKVERCTGSGCTNFVQVGTPTSNSYSDTSLTPSMLYRYQVRATDGVNNSGYSTIAQATTPAAPAVSYLQGASTTDTMTASFPGNNTAGNTIVAAISWGSNATPTCSDSQGNAYTVATNTYDVNKDQSLGVCYASNIKAGANTFTLNVGGANYPRILIHEYSGIASSSPVDVTKTNIASATTATNNVTSTAATTTQNNDLIFGAVMDDTGTTSITAGTNFTQRQSVNNKDLASQDYLQPTAGSIASTQTFGTTHRYLAHMVAFKTSASASFSPCNTVTTSSFSQAAYNAYGAPFDAFQTSTNLINANCTSADTHTINATLGVPGDTTRIVYTKGYYYAGSAWTQYSGTCTGALNGEWCQGSVSATITNPSLSTASAITPAYFVGMTCSVQGGGWKCGCRDTTCGNFYWQVQGAGL